MASNQDSYYLSLLALAEHFRIESPPRIRHCLQCLYAVLTCDPPPKVSARTHLQIANLLQYHTTNTQLARNHFEKAWSLSQNIPGYDEVRFTAVHQLCRLLLRDAASSPATAALDTATAKGLLLRAVELASANPQWRCKLLFQAASACSGDHSSACNLLQKGQDFAAQSQLEYPRLMFSLARMLVVLQEGSVPPGEVETQLGARLTEAGELPGAGPREHCRMFALVLLTTNQLNMGQVKSAKTVLKQLQHSIQTSLALIQHRDEAPCTEVQWMTRDELAVLVFLVSVRHSMHAGYMDKAHKYTEKALTQIDKIRDTSVAVGWLEALVLEHTALCQLVMGSKQPALSVIVRLVRLLRSNSTLQSQHSAQLHTLLAVYAMTMNDLPKAEMQFNAALRTSQNRELWTFANLNLALVYLRSGREADYLSLKERIVPEAAGPSHSLRAAAFYVQGMHAFTVNNSDDAKRHLREALKMANAEDLNRLTSCSLVLLGHLFYCANSAREAANMATPAMQLAARIRDVHLQIWAASILKDIHRDVGDAALAAQQEATHATLSARVMADHQRAEGAAQHARLLAWTGGALPHCDEMEA